MNSKKRYQIAIPSLSVVRDVFPINDKEVSYNWELESDKVFYEKKLKNKLIFKNDTKAGIDDFDFFYGYENSINRCAEFVLSIFKKCNGVEVLEFEGTFSLNDGDWDIDRCTVQFKADPNNDYQCFKKNKNKEVNILDLPNKITTSANLDYNYEFHYCANLTGVACSLPGANPSTWTQFQFFNGHSYIKNCTSFNTYLRVYYREFMVTACSGGLPSPPPGTGWILEQNNCGTTFTSKWVRSPLLGVVPFPNTVAIGWYNFSTNTEELPPFPSQKQIVVSATPSSEDLDYTYGTLYSPFVAGHSIDYFIEVPNNVNSTYAWSLNPGSPVTALISGATNVCQINLASTSGTGTLQVKLTETHGNGYVSTKIYSIPVASASTTFGPYTADPNIVGATTVCKNQTGILFSVPQLAVFTGGLWTVATAPTWTVTGGASIISGQGTRTISVNAGTSNFTVDFETVYRYNGGFAPSGFTLIIKKTINVSVSSLPVTPTVRGVVNHYPSEPNCSLYLQQRSTASYNWYRDLTNIGPGISGLPTINHQILNFTAPAGAGNYCYIVKETINCGCATWIKIGSAIANGTVGYFPPIYWCFNPTATTIFYTRNRLFQEACEYVLQEMGCSFNTIYSDFFEWNPIGDAPGYSAGNNYVLVNQGFVDTTNKLRYLSISQKSDVLNPTSSNAATKGMLTFEKMTKIWRELFHCFWFVDSAGRFRVEHKSFFNNTLAFDSTIAPHATHNAAKRKYIYNKESMPKFERFQFSEALWTDFVGADIWYDSVCVNQDPDGNVSERGTKDLLTTDLYALFIDPASANKVGFVLFCNDFDGTSYTVNLDAGNISGVLIANAHLSWANLHVNFHKYDRVLTQGYMNNVLTTFNSTQKYKQQKDVVLNVCCDDEFDPTMSYIKTELGNGIISSAEQNTSNGIIKATLLLD